MGCSQLRIAANARSAVLLAVALTLLSLTANSAQAAPREHAQVGISDPATAATPGLLEALAPRWRAAGVDVAAVTADWREIAPQRDAKTPPEGFDGSDPSSPLYDWANLDRVITVLRASKLEPLLTVTGPGPLWGSSDPARESARYRPDPSLFAAFAKAVALRYGGQVSRYIVWYEPNDAANLRPQSYCAKGSCSPRSPEIYRTIFNAAAPAIRASDPGAAIYAGALAGRGSSPSESDDALTPIEWLRAFGCINVNGAADRSSGSCNSFVASEIDGFAFHPDQRGGPPIKRVNNTREAGINDTSRLTRALDAIQSTGGVVNAADETAPIDLYYTEWGYQTNPPDVFSGVTLAHQSRWLQEGAKIVDGQPRVKLLGQYLWRDEPVHDSGQGVDAYAGGQSGLYGFDGVAKPAAATFPNPFWATSLPGSRSASLWGQVRPGGSHTVTVERRVGSRPYRKVIDTETDDRGYFRVKLPLGAAAKFRYSWNPGSTAKTRRHSDGVTLRPR